MRLSKVIPRAHVLSAARDLGNDKERKQRLAALDAMAASIIENAPTGVFPEVETAATAVREALAIASELDAAARLLKKARAGTEEAELAQEKLSGLRQSVDIMLPTLSATMQSMVQLMNTALGLEAQFADAQERAATLAASVKRDRERLAAVAQAVQSALKIG